MATHNLPGPNTPDQNLMGEDYQYPAMFGEEVKTLHSLVNGMGTVNDPVQRDHK